MLPGNESQALLGKVHELLRASGFADGGTEVMAGSDEGAFQWLAINFLLGSVGTGATAPQATVIDLGGGSMQVAYLLNDTEAKAAADRKSDYVRKVKLPLKPYEAHLYQNSYLGYGLMAGRAKVMKAAAEEGAQSKHPCFPKGVNAKYEYGGEAYTAVGAGNATDCAALMERVLRRGDPCGGDGCTFAGVWGGPRARGDATGTVLCSFFFDRLRNVGRIEADKKEASATPRIFEREAGKACSLATADLGAAYPNLKPSEAEWMCLDLSFLAALLLKGLSYTPDTPLRLRKEIIVGDRSYQASWPLGVALAQMGTPST